MVSPLPARITALSKALNDPRVLGVAQSLNMNLRDPATLRRLLAKANQYLSSTEVSLSQELAQPTELVPGQSAYVRNALRMYQEIAALK